jgi:Tol biopolymer transport system component
VAALNPRRARILIGGLIATGLVFTVLVLALDEDGPPGFPAGVRLPAETAAGAAWSPDGHWVAIPNRAGVLLRGAAGERSVQLQGPRTPRYQGAIPGRIGWSLDGSELRYVTTVGPQSGRGAWATTLPTGGGEARQVAIGRDVRGVDWARHGRRLVFASQPGATGAGDDAATPSALWELRGEDGRPRKLIELPGVEAKPELSPDDRRMLFAYRPPRRPDLELWIAAADGLRARRLAGGFRTLAYAWSPNGGKVAIVATSRGGDAGPRLYVVPARGGARRQLSAEDLEGTAPAWTPGGRWITYATGDGEIEKVRPSGGEPERIADFDGERVDNLLWSPNGKWLAYSREAVEPD